MSIPADNVIEVGGELQTGIFRLNCGPGNRWLTQMISGGHVQRHHFIRIARARREQHELEISQIRTAKAGQVIFRQGDQTDDLYGVLMAGSS